MAHPLQQALLKELDEPPPPLLVQVNAPLPHLSVGWGEEAPPEGGEDHLVHHGHPELLHEVQSEGGAPSPLGVEKAHLGVDPVNAALSYGYALLLGRA